MANLNTPIPQNKIEESFAWRDWFQKLSNRVYGSMSNQDSNAVFINGGTIDNTPIGANTPSTGAFTSLSGSFTIPWSKLVSQPHIEVYDLSASITVNNTATVLKPATTAAGSSGITYDSSTGVFTFAAAGSYSVSFAINALATSAGQLVYVYEEVWDGSAWTVTSNSGKSFTLTNGVYALLVYAEAPYRTAGQQIRYSIYSGGTTTSLKTQTLPTITSTVYVPAIRIQYS